MLLEFLVVSAAFTAFLVMDYMETVEGLIRRQRDRIKLLEEGVLNTNRCYLEIKEKLDCFLIKHEIDYFESALSCLYFRSAK